MKPVFLIIDMQNDYFQKESLSEQLPHLSGAINDLIQAVRCNMWSVVWVITQFAPNLSDAFLEMKKKRIAICIEGTEGAELLSELDTHSDDHKIVKKRYSAFYQTELDSLLNNIGATHLILAGINTHACIRSTAVDAYQRDFEVILAKDCIGSYDQVHHDVSWRYMNGKIGTGMNNQAISDFLSKGI
jgi:nicotinamidase-related amidase